MALGLIDVKVARIETNDIVLPNGRREPAMLVLEMAIPMESNKPVNVLNGFVRVVDEE